ncbi:MAG: PDGLE domain-containing protein [Methanomicrobiales archaeon]|jgi:cobalt/nickel transport protein
MENRTFIVIGIVIALLIGVMAVFLASSQPDGLESTALVIQGQKTLAGSAPGNAEIHESPDGKFSYTAPMPDYSLGEKLGPWGGIIAIIAGTLLAFGLVLGSSRLILTFWSRGKGKPGQ